MPKTYKHLTGEERDILAVLKSQGQSLREIAKTIKPSQNEPGQETGRHGKFYPGPAQGRAEVT